MPLPRATAGLLRAHIPRTASSARLVQLQTTQIRQQTDDLGGPGGQQPPPPNPGGPEAAKRNWIPIAGGGLALFAAWAYLTKPKESKEALEAAKQRAGDEATQSMQEMSGRDKKSQGPFRSE